MSMVVTPALGLAKGLGSSSRSFKGNKMVVSKRISRAEQTNIGRNNGGFGTVVRGVSPSSPEVASSPIKNSAIGTSSNILPHSSGGIVGEEDNSHVTGNSENKERESSLLIPPQIFVG